MDAENKTENHKRRIDNFDGKFLRLSAIICVDTKIGTIL